MEDLAVLKAVADETRIKIIKLLLKHNYCVGALAGSLNLTEAAVSQHLKILRGAGLVSGEKKGYFVHYEVKRAALLTLAGEIAALAETVCEPCGRESAGCRPADV